MKIAEAKEKVCPVMSTQDVLDNCVANRCMMLEPYFDEEKKEIDQTEETPEGWHQSGRYAPPGKQEIVRFIEKDEGDCGVKTKENGCFYPG